MKKNLPKTYEPQKYEDSIYEKWEKSGVFNPDNLTGENGRYSNILPPPNANGELHIGHSSGYVAMDLLGRYHRMLGKKTLLLPGKDHAGIQTQVVYEKKIKKERGISRHDLGRGKFYKEIYDFCIDRSQYMRSQEKKLGLSADWSREKFTLDPGILDTVLGTFMKMHKEIDSKGNRMAYRGKRLINWCPRCASALADVEVEHEEKKGKLYWIKYGPFVLATTRPETKLGDTAVAVHPDDKRYKHMVGKKYMIPGVLGEFEIKVVADKSVDPEFGSGAIKVTPSHSFADNEIAARHDLPSRQIINEEGKMMDNCGKYAGMTTREARKAIVADMKKMGLIDHIENDYSHSLSVCERCKTAIEPLPSEQWFINVDHKNFSLKKEARKVIEDEEIRIYPARFKKIMLNWIDNIHDWCISRQIWWGPRIPVWYKDGKTKVQLDSPGAGWKQDKDTFDTWFSSGQWAYTALGYPDGKDFKGFYPSDNMVMGRDILPFWAFRMIILSLYKTNTIPFKNLYFTGLIRDEHGKKMSKSKGNGIEPLEMIEKYGTDATRLSLVIGSAPGNDMNLGEARIAGFRNMVNKLWNVSRFILANVEDPGTSMKNIKLQTLADKWILSKFNNTIASVTDDLEKYRFPRAGETLKEFMWNDLADWYLEISKFEKGKDAILMHLLKNLLKLWHPFIPFVTEEIWQNFDTGRDLIISRWPKANGIYRDAKSEKHFDDIKKVVSVIRNARVEYNIDPAKKINLVIYAGKLKRLFESQENIIKNLRTGIKNLEIKESGKKIPKSIYISQSGIELYIPFEGVIDFVKERTRLQKELEKAGHFFKATQAKLQNKKFISSAPKEVIQKEKSKLAFQKEKIQKTKSFIKTLE